MAVLLVPIAALCNGDDDASLSTTSASTTLDEPASTVRTTTTTPPGPRPPLVDRTGHVPMAVDDDPGVVVALVDEEVPGSQTWALDLATLTWEERARADFDIGSAHLVYDPASDLIVAVTGLGSTFVYDVEVDRWSARTAASPSIGTLAFDPHSGHVVALGGAAISTAICTAAAGTPAGCSHLRRARGRRSTPRRRTSASSLATCQPALR